MSKPFVGWFFNALNAMPLDRGKVDSKTVRTIVGRLQAGRVVGIFPEGSIRTPESSVLTRCGVAGLALAIDAAWYALVALLLAGLGGDQWLGRHRRAVGMGTGVLYLLVAAMVVWTV